jgi:hypothetical protein
MSTVLNALLIKPFLVKMTKSGKVMEVKNVDSIFSNVFDKFPQLTNAQKQQISTQLNQAYGEKAFKGNFEMSTAIFPDIAVSQGDKWSINIKLESGMAGKIETIHEFEDKTDSYIHITGNSKISTLD